MSLITLLGVICSGGVTLAAPLDQLSTCGYHSCPESPEGNVLNIHLVAHTHDDVGWLKTYDQYYYGLNNSIQNAGVQYILDSVVQELLQDPKRRFIYVETAFFWKWWLEQDEPTRQSFKKLVDNGQLEFVGGAWSMHDEAAAHYQSMLDQTTWGFRKLVDTFGECGRPKVGWQIDPFGHSKENANLMANYGFDGLFLGRIDWADKVWRMDDKTMEMVWHTSSSDHSKNSKLFTGVLYNVYAAPKGFCFDILCQDQPIVDNRNSPDYNAKQKADEFVDKMMNYSKVYRTNNVLVTMGEDFQYQNAHINFKNMDKLIEHINNITVNGMKINAFYSTPSCYMKAVNDRQISFPAKLDDFMPYSSDRHSFWTGYYTSRPTSKYFERTGNNFLQVCKQLYSLSGLGSERAEDLNSMREAMGTMQHHDAITGTEKQHVADDYARILNEAFDKCQQVANEAFNKLMPKSDDKITVKTCLLKNISQCDVTETRDSFVVTLYNPISHKVDHLVRLPVPSADLSYSVVDPSGNKEEIQINEVPEEISRVPGRQSSAQAELVFIAKNIPPLGYKSYFVTKDKAETKSTPSQPGKDEFVGYEQGISVKIDDKGEITTLRFKGQELSLKQNFLFYKGWVGNNKEAANRSSGAYIFRPNGTAQPVNPQGPTKFKVFQGPLVSEIHQTYTDWVSQVIRIRKDSNYAEFQWLVGPIPIRDGVGKEIITRFQTNDINNGGVFLTDSNGREYLERKVNYRPSWPLQIDENISCNYYPVTTTISISDKNARLSVITDRAQGGTSLDKGQIELMVHRRLLHDDAFGVREALNETAFGEGLVAVGSHYVAMDDLKTVRKLVQSRILDAWTFISPVDDKTFSEWNSSFNMEYSGLKKCLPANVQILTLEPWKDSTYLLRLEHTIASSEDPELSQPIEINITDIFSNWTIEEVKEVRLGADRSCSDSKRLQWKEESTQETNQTQNNDEKCSDLSQNSANTIMLNPMEIKTFVIKKK